MRPALSVIFLTTLIGVGQGLFIALFVVDLLTQFRVISTGISGDVIFFIGGLSVILTTAGLILSFLHLGRPLRAYHAVRQWRTSWLSREVIAMPVFILLAFCYSLLNYSNLPESLQAFSHGSVVTVLGILATVASLILFVTTGMVYASIKAIAQWDSPLTTVNYMLFGLVSGFTLALVVFRYFELADAIFNLMFTSSFILLLIALVSKLITLRRNYLLKPKTTIQTALGIQRSVIRQNNQGAMGGSFNTREYFHGKSAKFTRNTIIVSLVLIFVLPLIMFSWFNTELTLSGLLIVFGSMYLGLLAERWSFFATGVHPQNLYYQKA